MLNAILHGKKRGLEQELIENFKVTEDFLTASVFERLLYLPDEKLWAILSSPEIWKSQIIITPGILNPFPSWRNFWPKWKLRSGLKMVEPDCFIEFENVVVIIEAKRYDDRMQQYVEQLGKELLAYWEMSLQKPIMLLAIGGLADYSSKTINKLLEYINNYLKSQPTTVPNFSFSAVPWSKLFKVIENQLKLSHEKRIIDDIREAMLLHGIEVRDPVWLADLRKLQLDHSITISHDLPTIFTGDLK